jgi:hypothetical protein
MAATALVLCNPAVFLLRKYGNLPQKVLKSALLDFYEPAAISNAKKNANFTDKQPNVPKRRGGEMRTVNEVNVDLNVRMPLQAAELPTSQFI